MPIKFHEITTFNRKVRELAQRYAQSLSCGSSPELTERYHQDLLEVTATYRVWCELRMKLEEQEVRFRSEIKEELEERKNRLETARHNAVFPPDGWVQVQA
jgi:hypothetical protein